MGLIQRATYRNGFLRSETWKDIRYKSLARWKSECFICLKTDFSNDVHHVWYTPHGWNKTGTEHTRVLCRDCHNEVHRRMLLDPAYIFGGKPKRQPLAIQLFNRVAQGIFNDRGRCETFRDRYARYEDRHPVKIECAEKLVERRNLRSNNIYAQKEANEWFIRRRISARSHRFSQPN